MKTTYTYLFKLNVIRFKRYKHEKEAGTNPVPVEDMFRKPKHANRCMDKALKTNEGSAFQLLSPTAYLLNQSYNFYMQCMGEYIV